MRRLAICLAVLCLTFGPIADIVSARWLEAARTEKASVSVEASAPTSVPIVADAAKNAFAASTSIPQGATALLWRGLAQDDSGSIPPAVRDAARYSVAVYPSDPSRAPPLLT